MAYIAANRGDMEGAHRLLEIATRDPGASREAWYYLGVYFQQKGRQAGARDAFARALAVGGEFFEALHDLGRAQTELGDAAAAVASLERATALQPRSFEAFYNKGRALDLMRRFDAALASYDRALELNPAHVESWTNRGAALHDLGRHDEALASFERAAALSPGHVEAWSGRGVVLHDLQRHAEALESFARAAKERPGDAEVLWRESFTRLAGGDFAAGWEKYEERWNVAGAQPRRHAAIRAWTGGEPLRGKRVLAWAEQGYGDTIQFCRYADLLLREGAEVVMEVQPALERLIASSFPDCRVIAQGAPLPACDLQVPLMGLARAFATRLETIPARIPYLKAHAAKVRDWRERLGAPGSRLDVAIACSGSAAHRQDRARTIALDEFTPLGEAANLFLVQKDIRAGDEPLLGEGTRIRALGDALADFDDTAAAVACMDLVISVDTSLVHLAGALGKPVWILLPWAPDWRWLASGEASPWYPTARLFRQRRGEPWREVMARVARALSGWPRP